MMAKVLKVMLMTEPDRIMLTGWRCTSPPPGTPEASEGPGPPRNRWQEAMPPADFVQAAELGADSIFQGTPGSVMLPMVSRQSCEGPLPEEPSSVTDKGKLATGRAEERAMGWAGTQGRVPHGLQVGKAALMEGHSHLRG